MKEDNTIHILTFNTADFDEQWSYAIMGSHDLEKLELYKKQLEDDSDRIRKKIIIFRKDKDEKMSPVRDKLYLAFKEKKTSSYNHDEYKKTMKELTALNTHYHKEYQKLLKEFSLGHENMIDDPDSQYLEIDKLQMLD
jgi:hypothetical protein